MLDLTSGKPPKQVAKVTAKKFRKTCSSEVASGIREKNLKLSAQFVIAY